MPQMDRCWFSDDGYQVTSRILITDWGKVKQCRVVNRGCPKDPTQLALNSQGMLSNTKDRNKSKTFLSHRRRLPPLQVASKK